MLFSSRRRIRARSASEGQACNKLAAVRLACAAGLYHHRSQLLHGLAGLVTGMMLLGCEHAGAPGMTGRPIPLDELEYVRLSKDRKKESQSLDVSIVRFAPVDEATHGVSVDLIGAVHVGDEAYYRELNRRFRQYDAVLYELVAPAGTRVAPGQRSSSLVSMIQRQMKQLLGLTFQLDAIDYTKRNMVHADLSPTEVKQRMQERGESWLGIFVGVMLESMKKSSTKPWANDEQRLLLALLSRDREHDLKRIMAEQMADLETMTTLFEGANGSTMINDRNERAMEVLKDQIEEGKKRIGIFYGAGHMPDLAKTLVNDFDLVPVQEEWLEAWDLRARRQ